MSGGEFFGATRPACPRDVSGWRQFPGLFLPFGGGATFFTKTANGARLTTADSQEFIDFVLTLGTAIHGHNDPKILNAIRVALDRGASFGTPNPLEVKMANHGLEEDAGDVLLLDDGSHVGSHDALGVLIDDEEDAQGTSFHFKVPGVISFCIIVNTPRKLDSTESISRDYPSLTMISDGA